MSKRRCLVIVGIVAAAALLAVLLYTILGDHRPVIASVHAEPELLLRLGSCRIVCNATDPDGDELSYNWSAARGAIEMTGEADTIVWRAPLSVGFYDVHVAVTDGRGGTATGRVTVTVRTNLSPIISSLIADTDWISPSDSIQVTCNASDTDGDELSYEWTTDGGHISGSGAVVTWTAPQKVGTYNITVVVKDGYGGEETGKLSLGVNLATPPTVEELRVTPKGHEYLRNSHTAGYDYDVWLNKEYDIQCVAIGTGDLVYEWYCDDGWIVGEGSTITWIAPDHKYAEATVTVTVLDAEENGISKGIIFYVPSCTCGSWGLKSGEITF
ncbi:MAG: hypothetical protein A2Z77_06870 [Chloroflexi bacterium RBG_13_51_36]|nr:MAG: hypothetical protein A2Z77_06870 [Chloroflexi bacterium RBG_13_51_36]